jgi:AraC family transcriptional regulator of adaptative response/methylated-DNA-[protein]-cysteine methyltransferase
MTQPAQLTTLDDRRRWQAVLERSAAADGQFVYAVTSTGVFCRPTCPSRRPRPDRVRFFASAAAAAQAGFRACRRCRPASSSASPPTSTAIADVSRYIATHADEALPLEALAMRAGLSPSHFQRQFKKHVGLSPREYQAACRADRFRRELRDGRDVTSAIYAAGYGSPSRVYESSPTGAGMTPATYRRGGAGVRIGFVTLRCGLGWVLVAATSSGVCAVRLGDTARELEQDLRREFNAAAIARDEIVPMPWVQAVLRRLEGSRRPARTMSAEARDGERELPLDILGTAFQWRVWRALQAIPSGETRTYSDVARAIGRPAAVRAVARACATNPVCLLVPCHRVVPKDGSAGGYRWGTRRKIRLIEQEAAARRGAAQATGKAK